jgi:hypothetical protein
VQSVGYAKPNVTRLQKNAKHPETFTPNYITLTPAHYESMVRTMHLPFRAIEGTSVVGPFFWAAYDQDGSNPHLRKTPLLLIDNGSERERERERH